MAKGKDGLPLAGSGSSQHDIHIFEHENSSLGLLVAI